MSGYFHIDNVFRYNFINNFIKIYNITDNNYFEKINLKKIFFILEYYYINKKIIDKEFKIYNFNNNFCSLLEVLYKKKININELIILIINFFDKNNKNRKNIINYLIKISNNAIETFIINIFENFIEKNNIVIFEKFIKILYIEYKPKIFNILQKILNDLIYHYDNKNIIFINLIINNIKNSEFIDIIENETSFIFNLIVEYHYDIEFQKYIISKNIPKYLLFNSIIDSIIHMSNEYLIEHSFNNEINQIIINNIDNNNLNLLDIYKNNENQEKIKNKINELNIEFNNFYSFLLYIYNKFNFNDKKDIIDTLNNNFINNLKFCCINTYNYIQFIDSENKEFNWRKKSPLLLVWYFEDKSKKRKFNEVKLTEMPFDMIREIISFI